MYSSSAFISSSPLPTPSAYAPFSVPKKEHKKKTIEISTTPITDRIQEHHKPSRKELLPWMIVFFQSLLLFCAYHGNDLRNSLRFASADSYMMNEKPFSYHYERFLRESKGTKDTPQSFYEPPVIHKSSNKKNDNSALVGRVWHSNKSPGIHDGMQTGSCWCSVDDFCMCTPMLAIDIILTTPDGYLWLIKRHDTGKFALAGGFNEVGETVEEASRRELSEEMGITLPEDVKLDLLGVYSDPRRDQRKHSVSIVFHIELPLDMSPIAGDDAKEVVRIPLLEIGNMDLSMHADHTTVIRDFLKKKSIIHDDIVVDEQPISSTEEENNIAKLPIKRSIC